MKQGKYKLIAKKDLYFAEKIWSLQFEAPDIEALPGQFVNLQVEGQYLRRPISVSEYEDSILTLIVDVVGEGTRKIVETPVGSSIDMLTGLGNSFDIHPRIEGDQVILIGGGVGYAPLVGLMKRIFKDTDLHPFAVFGFNRKRDVPFHHIEELREEGYPLAYCTMSGEMGDHGNALEVIQEYIEDFRLNPSYFYTCGPLPMMRAVCNAFDFDGQLSMESRMGCGFGACMGCSIPTVDGPKRICKEGPVFTKSKLNLR